MERFEKLKLSMRYWLQGRGDADRQWYKALEAFEFAAGLHTGLRKNGEPEFIHQLAILHHLRTMQHCLRYPVETFIVGAVHDVPEDKGVGIAEIESLFGGRAAHSTNLVTKEFRGVRVPEATYFGGCAGDPIASAIKAPDRVHNMQSSLTGFNRAKRREYCNEVRTWYFPMLKTSRRSFPDQEPLYENCKLILRSQLEFLDALDGEGA